MSASRVSQIINTGQSAVYGRDTLQGVATGSSQEFSLSRIFGWVTGHVLCDTWQQLKDLTKWTATGTGSNPSGDGTTTGGSTPTTGVLQTYEGTS